ncbi:uncharacterized protein LOC117643728 [Thrips palmi]|uniref:Uncharacterized protein LOC117643728 n=1 Tax=Thrips palmi TaxID=161013 RepID=A0A6P8YG26_THRPL|nr:uncharacterized protein LOC117643728 [Thrips palmi]
MEAWALLLVAALAGLWPSLPGPGYVAARKDHCNKTVDVYEDVGTPEVTPENFGKPLTCTYRFRSLRGARRDGILRIRFKKFKVGTLVNASTCLGGYMQIIDGNAKSDLSNRKEPGEFCGESEQPQTFISETSFVRLLFHTDNFTDQTYLSFDSRAEEQFEVYLRYGQHPELYPNRRGQVLPGTYCERVFQDCKLQTCYVQSPAYPGVYPRHLHCRYQLNTRLPFIKLYIENEEFNIDGHRCENIMTCPMRPISSGSQNCPYDYIRIYDGKNETAPVIGTFCGMGKFPYSIIGTGEDLFVEFVTSPAGPLLNTGFHFNVGNWPGHVEPVGERTGTCSWRLSSKTLSKAGDSEGIFLSVAHWYPPHTSCTYLIQGEPNQIVRLYFPSFRINRIESPIEPWPGDCGESLTLYDASWPDDSRIIKTFCDTFSRALEKHDFVSTGNALFIRFESKTGSYSGSSLYYWAHYDFFNNTRFGDPVPGTPCDETFLSWRSRSGVLRSPLNTLIFKQGATTSAPERTSTATGALIMAARAQAVQEAADPFLAAALPPKDIRCTYRFVTDKRLFARIILNIHSLSFKTAAYNTATCGECWSDRVDKLLAWEPQLNSTGPLEPPTNSSGGAVCLCKNNAYGAVMGGIGPLRMVSQGEELALQLLVDGGGAVSSYFKHNSPLFEAEYRFIHGPLCGPTLHRAADEGDFLFPHLEALAFAEPPRDIHCIWELQVHRDRDLWLHFEKVKFPSRNCSDGKVEVFLPGKVQPFLTVCGDNETALRTLPMLSSKELTPLKPEHEPSVTIHFTAFSTPARTAFKIAWTELHHLPRTPEGTLMTSKLQQPKEAVVVANKAEAVGASSRPSSAAAAAL